MAPRMKRTRRPMCLRVSDSMGTVGYTHGKEAELAKELRDALYRARATMAEGSHIASSWGNAQQPCLEGFQQIDRSMQAGVEDADRALIEYEKTRIFHLWVCPSCGSYQLPDNREGIEEGVPECSCGRFFGDPVSGDPGVEMEKVMVERMD